MSLNKSKVCCGCREDLPVESFSPNPRSSDGFGYRCRACRNRDQNQRRAALSREEKRRRSYGTHLKRRYGMTLAELEKMIDSQGGRCLICGELPTEEQIDLRWGSKGLNVDHDHETGEVRGLLCTTCNLMLGAAKDRIDILQKGIDYLCR